jgi:hypothetical protein
MLATEIPYSAEIERMSVRRAPLPACAPRSVAAELYRALWAEVRPHLHDVPAPAVAPDALAKEPDAAATQLLHA